MISKSVMPPSFSGFVLACLLHIAYKGINTPQSLQVFFMPIARLNAQCVFLHTPSFPRLRETTSYFRLWFVGNWRHQILRWQLLSGSQPHDPHSHAENSLIAHPRRRHQTALGPAANLTLFRGDTTSRFLTFCKKLTTACNYHPIF